MSSAPSPTTLPSPTVNNSNFILAIIGTIADVCGLCSVAAQLFRQDLWLTLTIVFVMVSFILLLWRAYTWIARQKFLLIISFLVASVIFAVISVVSLSKVRIKPVNVSIVEPKDGAQVEGYRCLVKGSVNDSDARVSVVVRPLTPTDYWVQEVPTKDANGNWQINAHLGENNVGDNEGYEISALATNENFIVTWVTGNSLSAGKHEDLPGNTNRSNIVTVTRVR